MFELKGFSRELADRAVSDYLSFKRVEKVDVMLKEKKTPIEILEALFDRD